MDTLSNIDGDRNDRTMGHPGAEKTPAVTGKLHILSGQDSESIPEHEDSKTQQDHNNIGHLLIPPQGREGLSSSHAFPIAEDASSIWPVKTNLSDSLF